ncbi:hypothetical protein LFYK43_21880 [Ligilactobacillus salitolerans]|uniref:Uncharacterized protein n=1 Tax=Ligilactobacillus salitolerans TaxID=1808352 RepID=A0A401IW33_9LACO|nr:hypothetical protein LFYK43_21880 [Ligilactobacillus salitolerans]
MVDCSVAVSALELGVFCTPADPFLELSLADELEPELVLESELVLEIEELDELEELTELEPEFELEPEETDELLGSLAALDPCELSELLELTGLLSFLESEIT